MFGPGTLSLDTIPTLLRQGGISTSSEEYSGDKFRNFDGVNEAGDLAPSESFWMAVSDAGAGNYEGTIAFWFKMDDVFSPTNNRLHYIWGGNYVNFPNVSGTYIATKNDGGTNRIIVYRANINVATSTVVTWSNVQSTSAATLADDTWHHMAVGVRVFMGGWQTVVYLNGAKHNMSVVTVPNATTVTAPGDSTLDWVAGRYSTTYSEVSLNEVGMWTSFLGALEIGEIYNAGVNGLDLTQDTGNYASSSDLWSWHKMGEDTAPPTEPDSSGNGRDMTLINTPTIEDL